MTEQAPDKLDELMQRLRQPEVVTAPGRTLTAEEMALQQFHLLVETYAGSIAKLNGDIGGQNAEIKVLEAGIARIEKAKAETIAERDMKFGLLESVNAMIRTQEDAIRARGRLVEDAERKRTLL